MPTRPKILVLHMEYPPMLGGGGRYTQNLLGTLSKQDCEIILLTSGERDEVEEVNANLTVKRFRALREIYHGRGGVLSGIDILLREIRTEAPDILHTAHIEETLIGRVANLQYGLPHFVTHHKTPMYRSESLVKNSTWALFEYVSAGAPLSYIAPSEAFRQGLLLSGVPPGAIRVVYPGVDRSHFQPERTAARTEQLRAKLGIRPTDAVVLVPCVVRKRKGIEFVARALSTLRVPGRDVKLLVSALPRTPEEETLLMQCTAAAVPIEVIEHGAFSDDEMPLVYSIADVVVLCSEAEGLGLALLEAMACHRPVIGTDVMGINEVIRDGYSGLLCPPGDEESLRRSVSRLLTDAELRTACVHGALEMLDATFSSDVQAQRHIELYESAIRDRVQRAYCVLIRAQGAAQKVLLVGGEDGRQLPSVLKLPGESWLEGSTRAARDHGHIVSYPRLVLTAQADRTCAYGFDVSDPLTGGAEGFWTPVEAALDLVKTEAETEVLRTLMRANAA